LAIGRRLAKDGANVVILAKTATPHPKLPGTISTACKEIEEAGGRALGIQCDIRSEEEVKKAIE
jgi:citronellol/citronellal dehydrogenase